jgi:regulatory protein
MLTRTGTTLSLKGRALRALAAREHSRAELARKLAAHVGEGDDLNAVLDELSAKGFLDDQRAADALAHRRGAKLGTARVVQELKAKGVDAEAISVAAEQLRTTELERAREVWRRKFGSPALDASERGKQMRFLTQRGFSAEVVRRVVAGVTQAD